MWFFNFISFPLKAFLKVCTCSFVLGNAFEIWIFKDPKPKVCYEKLNKYKCCS